MRRYPSKHNLILGLTNDKNNYVLEVVLETIDIWSGSVTAAMTMLWTNLANFAPKFVGAILILLIGYLVAKAVSALLTKMLVALGVDRFSQESGVSDVLSQANVDLTMSSMLGQLVFWILMLTVLVSATETLGLVLVSETIGSLVHYLPKVLGAAFILLMGLFVAGLVRDLLRSAADGIGFEYARTLGTFAYALLVVIVVSLSVGQLELETAVLTQAISIVLISVGAAGALAFGLGSRDVAANVLAGSYLRESFLSGDRISVEEVSGRVMQVGSVNTILETESGEISVPNSLLIKSVTTRLARNSDE